MFEAQQTTQPTKRGLYAKFTPEEKAEVGKRAALQAEHGVVETVLGLHVYCRNLVWELAVWGVRTNGRAWLIGSIRRDCRLQDKSIP